MLAGARTLPFVLALLLLSGCGHQQAAPVTAAPAAAACPVNPDGSILRPDIPAAELKAPCAPDWPPRDGFTSLIQLTTLQPGTLLDRFGPDSGRFLSPQGESYASRALPWVCTSLRYHVYKVDRPLTAEIGTAAAYFGEPGGAIQIKLSRPVARFLAERVLSEIPANGAAVCQ